MKHFFASCSEVQLSGDRVHITVPCPSDYRKNYYQGYVYDLTTAASLSGYQLLKKRKLEKSRYPEYIHVKTNKNEKADVMESGAREFIFRKVDREQFLNLVKKVDAARGGMKGMANALAESSPKNYSIGETEFHQIQPDIARLRAYFVCSSDEESSGYESN